ncbi:MAG TPA: diguanylate cyclase [Gammaproteobacteria bacterium]|nr:diguanylate cyclase [Gammaproteobacteria bacterium]
MSGSLGIAMNYSVVPDLLGIGGLVAVFILLLRRTHQARLRYWAFGWVLILIHFAVELAPSDIQLIAEATTAIAISTLLLSSVAFLWASDSSPAGRARSPWITLLGAAPDIIFCVCLAYGISLSGVYLLLTGLGAISSFALYCTYQRKDDRLQKFGKATFILAAYGIQFGLILGGHLSAALIWLLCWHFLAAASAFFLGAPKAAIGVWFTTICFVAWALVFPVGLAMDIWFPDVQIAPGVWNLPKYLVAAGMLVTLLEEQMFKFEHAALHDALTGIPNRRMFVRELEEATGRRDFSFALMILDLDLFKQINDDLGHLAGDETLRQIAQRLRHSLRQHDRLARIGGDEFAVLLPDVQDQATADTVAAKIQSVFEQPFAVGSQNYLISVSVGYVLAPAEGAGAEELYALADQRMYQAKQRSRRAPQMPGDDDDSFGLPGATGTV